MWAGPEQQRADDPSERLLAILDALAGPIRTGVQQRDERFGLVMNLNDRVHQQIGQRVGRDNTGTRIDFGALRVAQFAVALYQCVGEYLFVRKETIKRTDFCIGARDYLRLDYRRSNRHS